ncbi:AI-2E family transporter [Sinorhizobium meliloti]|uniref:AI-2E family transporter n=1 Tax=Rhizobium meliloti TaxID=382 RepID=UPI000FD9AB0E|nr:AI-2E family transporter [Sinorhizobium meliloti]RVG87385.1 AI-2E family transporter [Sinorhizobium meliloti]RVI39484.1 AI-2E family transporter [Sinorhizobium meliloti]RVI49249.1 AI-2E family transporter [Sinorhizobium meliloti]RVJ30438.1 AI-2E family transporter [Sinorhizobium meliloti]RVK04005.1 AI-2E family transporter [Sinorhizobium meliloti]
MPAARIKIIYITQILIATLLLLAMLSMASSIFAPVAFALFIITLVWPMQCRLQAMLPRSLALIISFLLVVLAIVAFGWLIAWAFGHVGRWIIADAARFQQLYDHVRLWLEEHGVAVGVLWSENFGAGWVLHTVQAVSGRLNSTFSFWLIALVYVLLGLMEIEAFGRRIEALRNRTASALLLHGSQQTAMKIRRYMMIRTVMSVVTGLLVWIFTRAVGLSLAEEWGFIAFALNYIPFLGPLLATLFPTLFALIQFGTMETVLIVFTGLNLIQFVVSSYIEPRASGSALSMSPVMVLFSVFLWGYLWGIFGAFIGVPITIALLTFCNEHPSSKWLSELFGLEMAADQVASTPSG